MNFNDHDFHENNIATMLADFIWNILEMQKLLEDRS